MGARHWGREAALRMLYQSDLSGEEIEQVIQLFLAESLANPPLDENSRQFALRLVRGVRRRLSDIDELIRGESVNWRLERMGAVDRNVLRLALFELLEDPSTPSAVVLDEAVELAKIYGGEDSGAFVNGVLDGIRRQLDRKE